MNQKHDDVASAARQGAREAFGVPAAVLGAGFIGYGSLAAEHGYTILQIVAATGLIWALPGQLILIELHALSASAIAIIAAVALSGARFLPMAMSVMPVLHERRFGRPTVLITAQFVSMTSWAVAMQRCPALPAHRRIPYFAGFGATCVLTAMLCAMIGYALAGMFPPVMRLGFVFLAPVYFFVILIGDVRTRLAAIALACGAFAGPLFHLLTPEWSVLAAGFAGGTAAYWLQRRNGRSSA